ncbi:MAG: EAL domain-containing protein [Sulfurisoma sp.]|nr:EAL domain-containing protein [Sulfurisoma sp.]
MATEEVFIGRQPILDRKHDLFAYELLFRSGRAKNEAHIHDDLAATASVVNHAFAELGIEQALGPYKGFINCDATLLRSDIIEILPPDKIVLEVLETVEVTPEIVERCKELKARGFMLALDDFVNYEDKWLPLLDLVEIVKVDLMPLDQEGLARTTQALKRWPLQLLAEKVDSREQARHCHDLGYALFQGYYFAKPVIIAGRKLGHSQLSLMRLLGLVLGDAETNDLEAVFKREPGLAMNLMRLTNSVATGVRTKVTSLRHAITVLGRRQLQRWLQILLYTNPAGGSVASPLLQLAATRGRLMELMAGKLHPGNREAEDRAFMAGIMSLMPTLMGVTMDEVLNGVNLTGDVREALESRGGELGTLLLLSEALETSDGQACHDLTEQLPGADHTVINTCLTQALTWASNIGRENE